MAKERMILGRWPSKASMYEACSEVGGDGGPGKESGLYIAYMYE